MNILENVDLSLTIELSTLIIAGIFLLAFAIVLLVKLFSKSSILIDGLDIGLDGLCFHVCNDKAVRQIAYKIWVEINTRTIGVKIDLEKDIVRSIHESYYSFFTNTRLLIEDIPVSSIKKSEELVSLSISFLNNVMRPYLTKWGIKFNDWYDNERDKNKKASPQEFQKSFKEYDELCNDLINLNNNIVNYSEKLKRIAFNEKEYKKNK